MLKLAVILVVICYVTLLTAGEPVYGAPRAKYSMDYQAQSLFDKFGDNKMLDLIRFCQYLPTKSRYSQDVAEDCERLLKVVGFDGSVGY
uniref:Uncharacterized protein n=1 Tax=Plectus sambesii TaxID=2011161 RepID=A0A914VFH1_9BILA